jgi:hypothetical protein
VTSGGGDAELLASIPPAALEATLLAASVPPPHVQALRDAAGVRGWRVGFYSNQLCERCGRPVQTRDLQRTLSRELPFTLASPKPASPRLSAALGAAPAAQRLHSSITRTMRRRSSA